MTEPPRFPAPVFPRPPSRYEHVDESQFRAALERYLTTVQERLLGLTPEIVGSDPEGSAADVQSNLDAHTSNEDIHAEFRFVEITVDGQQVSRMEAQ